MVSYVLREPYHGINLQQSQIKTWASRVCSFLPTRCVQYVGNEKGVKINIQVSLREKPILPCRARHPEIRGTFKGASVQPRAFPSLPTRK